MNNFESPEKKEYKWENLSEIQKELLKTQFGVQDAEALEDLLSGESEFSGGDISPQEAAELAREMLRQIEEGEVQP